MTPPRTPHPLIGRGAQRPGGPLWRAGPLAWLILLAIALAWDRAGYLHLSVKTYTDLLDLEGKDWYRALRIFGFGGTWAAFGLVLLLIDFARRDHGERLPGGPLRRAVLLWLSVAASALFAEVLKPLFGRLRPEDTGGDYAFMPLARRLFDAHDLGLPSSHTAAAFGAALALSLCFRPATLILLAAAAGCGLTRVLAGAHFLSDAVAGAAVAYAATLLVWRLDARNNGGIGLGEPNLLPAAATERDEPPPRAAPRPAPPSSPSPSLTLTPPNPPAAAHTTPTPHATADRSTPTPVP
jgi:membrane-associated phospholipid phosphatase